MKGNRSDRPVYSEHVQEIMGTVPSWITRWGITIFFTIITGILAASCLIDYPQTLSAPVTVLVTDKGTISGRMMVAPSGVGRIQIGQKAIVRLDCYPYLEYGTFEGEVCAVSHFPEETANGQLLYAVDLIFPERLVSRYGYTADYFRKMSGSAKIILQSQKLIGRIMHHLESGRRTMEPKQS